MESESAHPIVPTSAPRLQLPPCRLTAYEVAPNPGYILEPASPRRDWMDAAPAKFPYRCLPLVMANQAGWFLRSPFAFSFTWNGGLYQADMKITPQDPKEPVLAWVKSHFGLGIITFQFPWIFRTAPGYGLWVHGPANNPVDNCTMLEGLVETDWSYMPFTMNWKVQRRNVTTYIQKGQPLCVLTPFPFDLLEAVDPVVMPITADPEFKAAVEKASRERAETNRQQFELGDEAHKIWERTYFKGEAATGEQVQTHRTNFKLKRFEPPGSAASSG